MNSVSNVLPLGRGEGVSTRTRTADYCQLWKDVWDSNIVSLTGEPRASVKSLATNGRELDYEIIRMNFRIRVPEWLHAARDLKAATMLESDPRHSLVGSSARNIPAVLGYRHPPSRESLCSLQSMQLDQLRAETRHIKKVLLVRLTGDPQRFSGIVAPVADEEGGFELVSIPFADPDLLPFEIMQKGTILAIKEPYFGMSVLNRYAVCVNHISDMVQLSDSDVRVPTAWRRAVDRSAEQWKEAGDRACMTALDFRALACYNEALRTRSSIDRKFQIAIRNNCALLFLRQRLFQQSIGEARSVLGLDPKNIRALQTIALSSYQLELYTDCLMACTLLKAMNFHVVALKCLPKVYRHLAEQRGQYDFSRIISMDRSSRPMFNFGSFTKRVHTLKSESYPSKSGLFIREDVKAGDLLLCEKALAVAYDNEVKKHQKKILNVNTVCMTTEVQAHLTQKLVNKSYLNPMYYSRVLHLACKVHEKPEQEVQMKNGPAIVDSFLMQEIVEVHSSQFPHRSTAHQLVPFEGRYCRPTESSKADETERQCYGLWPIAATANHACLPNAHISYIGNMLIMRATKEVKKGEEIFLSYIQASESYEHRRRYSAKKGGVACECKLCEAESRTPKELLHLRDMLHESFKDSDRGCLSTSQHASKVRIAQLQRIVAEIAKTYHPDIYTALARVNLTAPLLRVFELCALYKTSQGQTDFYLVLNAAHRYLHDGLALSRPRRY